MILIVGSTRDDILYFQSIIKNKREETILKKYTATLGTIFNQQVMLLDNVYSPYLSSALTTYIIEKYYVILTFVVGKCYSFSKGLNNGDIAISRSIVLGDVDRTDIPGNRLGQIPTLPQSYIVPEDVVQSLCESFEKRTYSHYHECYFVSTSTKYTAPEQIERNTDGESMFGVRDNIVFDCVAGGSALACFLADIPCVAIKVIENQYVEQTSVNGYIKVLKEYANVGKAVISFIGEIGSNAVLRERG